jgi:hypothetical protein
MWEFVKQFQIALRGKTGTMVVVGLHVANQYLVDIEVVIAPVRSAYITNAVIDELGHHVDSRQAKRHESVLNPKFAVDCVA